MQFFFALEYSSGLSNHNIDTVTTEERKLEEQQRTGDNRRQPRKLRHLQRSRSSQGEETTEEIYDAYSKADRYKRNQRVDLKSVFNLFCVLLVCKKKREDREKTQGTAIKTIQMNNKK